MEATIVNICTSEKKGPKKTVLSAQFIEGIGIKGDVHAGSPRQVSLLSEESIKSMKGLKIKPGSFGENIVTRGIEINKLKIGTRIQLGADVILEITGIGKECHKPCQIALKVGTCVMPTDGVFAKVVRGGELNLQRQTDKKMFIREIRGHR